MTVSEIDFLKGQLKTCRDNLAALRARKADQGESSLDLGAEIEYAEKRVAQLEEQLARAEAAHDPALLGAYLDYVIESHRYVDLWGVMRGRHPVQMRLDEFYVPLHVEAEPEPTPADQRLMEREVEEMMARPDLSPDRKENLREQLRAQRLFRPELRLAKRIPLWEAVRENERLVILGAPGAGKTTFLRYLALRFSQAMKEGVAEVEDLGEVRLPIYIRVAEFATARQENPDLSLDDYLKGRFHPEEVGILDLPELLRRYLAEGRGLVLLDGLDEVIDPGERVQITRCIESFVAAHGSPRGEWFEGEETGFSAPPSREGSAAPGGNRFIVTSRITGYRAAPLTGGFALYTLRGLESGEIRPFLERWCLSAERARAPGFSEEVLWERVEWKIESLVWAMEVNPGLRRLATRPLMLVLLALTYRRGMRLPQRRIELYELATQTLLRNWQLAQDIPSVALVQESEAVRLLGPLAYWLRENRPSGLATEDEVEEVLRETLTRQSKSGEGSLQNEGVVEELKGWVCQHSGLFKEVAPGCYGFVHPTFEEYFAARELVTKPTLAAERLREHLHQPRWNEPILLAIGFISTDYPVFASDLVEGAVLAWGEKGAAFSPSPYEDVLHRDLLFAARCIADDIDIDPTLRYRIIHKLLNLYFDQDRSGRYTLLRERIIAALADLRDSEGEVDMVDILLSALEGDRPARSSAVRVLGCLDPTRPEVIPGLVAALKDEDWHVRYYAAEALGHLGVTRQEVVWGLMVALKDECGPVRDSAAEALGNMGCTASEVVWRLMAALKDDDKRVRASVYWALSNLGQTTPRVVHILLTALRVDDWLVRDSVIRALGRLGQARPEVMPVLLAALKDDNWRVRYRAIYALNDLNQAKPEVLQGLLDALRDEHEMVRASAAEALGDLGEASPQVLKALLTTLEDSGWRGCSAAARALGHLGRDSPQVMESLLAALRDGREAVRSAAARALGDLGVAKPEVVRALLVALEDEGRYVRYNAARSLSNLDQATPEVVQGLLRALGDKHEVVRDFATRALGRLGRTSPDVARALLTAVGDEKGALISSYPYIRYYATSALEGLGQVTPEVRQVLLSTLKSDGWRARSFAAQALGNSGQARPEVIHGLLAVLQDDDWRVRSAAAEALRGLGQASLEVVQALLGALKDHNWCVRSSAASALGELGQASPDVIRALLGVLADERQAVRASSARVLGDLGQATPEVISGLLIALREGNRYVRSSAARALSDLNQLTPEVIHGLLFAFKSTDKHVRFSVAEALARFKGARTEVIKALLTALTDRDKAVRSTAAEALGGLGRVTPEMAQALLVTLRDEGRYVRYYAAEALGNLGSIRGLRGAGRAWRIAIADGLCRALDDPRNEEQVYLKRGGCIYDFVYEALVKVVDSLSVE